MLPLEPLAKISTIERLILGARAPEAAAEIVRLKALLGSGDASKGGAPASGDVSTTKADAYTSASEAANGDVSTSNGEVYTSAALRFAEGALSLREGSLGPAQNEFEAAATAFAAAGDSEAAEFCAAEALLAKMRRGGRATFGGAAEGLADLATKAQSPRARVVAKHYHGAALRLLGDAQATQRTLLSALSMADVYPAERPKILNSLGTLYVVLGAYGAAEALLEHAAELHHQRGDAVGEAIASGQLGAAALGLGDLAKARTWLQRQEWLASQVGDAFGRARALTFLADVALDMGRPDDALGLANLARDVARTTTPPLAVWLAYATRAAGRAHAELGNQEAEAELRDAEQRFTEIGNILGLALTEWDLARALGEAGATMSAESKWSKPAWSLASLGLAARVAGLLRDHAETLAKAGDVPISADDEETFFAVAQPAPHLAVPREIELVYEAPEVLGAVSNRRTAAQRNLSRLGALTLAPPGLMIATVRWGGAPRFRALPPERAACAAIGAVPQMAQWAWPLTTSAADIAKDIDALRAALATANATEVLISQTSHPRGRVVSPPFAGEVGATVEGLEDAVAPNL